MHKRPWKAMYKDGRHDASIMHPHSPYYGKPPDFVALAIKYPSLREYVNVAVEGKLQPVDDRLDASEYAGKGIIDFKNPKAERELTYCLFRHDFGVEVEFPLDTLCPTIPNRVNYVCWIEDLVGRDRENVLGIDIGVGASCVYPLLVTARQRTWRMVGTDIDEKSLEYATKNVARNHLEDRISIVKNPNAAKTLPLELFPDSNQTYDFCMCNPPFFEDDDDFLTSLGSKRDAPAATLKATDSELKTAGGEVEFVKRMIDESLALQTRVRWYTSMLGKKSSVNTIVAYLRQCSIFNFTLATFRQGRTFRWAIAWSHHAERAPKATWNSISKDLKMPTDVLSFPLPGKELKEVFSSIKTILGSLDITYDILTEEADQEGSPEQAIRGDAYTHSWSRAARRAKARQAQESAATPSVSSTAATVEGEGQDPVLGFELRVHAPEQQLSREQLAKKQRVDDDDAAAAAAAAGAASPVQDEKVTVEVLWLVGKDRELFDSFVRHLRSRLEEKKK